MNFALRMAAGIGAVLFVGILLTFERPPIESVQTGYRGLGMEQLTTRKAANEARQAVLAVPEALEPAAPGGPLATADYKNVKVLTDLNVEQFNRLMLAMTQWVAPEQGCTACHVADDLASDEPYAKNVARRMLQMTRQINKEWQDHVGQTGVTCYTCHRGNALPSSMWVTDPGPAQAGGMAASRSGQNLPGAAVGYTSLPFDPFSPYLAGQENIRVVSTTALPTGKGAGIKQTEGSYGLMMHMSDSLGVNCTLCHNTRSFASWRESNPQRVTAFHGLRMVRELNATFLEPLKGQVPTERLGPLGDAPKAGCGTCHQGSQKPLLGINMIKDYPELR